jgi:hypothetical protein
MTAETVSSRGPTASFSPGSLAGAFRDRIQSFCTEVGFTFLEIHDYDPPQLRVEFSFNFPMWIRIDVDSAAGTALMVGVVRTYGSPGDRSDYHDLISLLWAAEMRRWNEASVRLIDIPHPVIPGELWGRYVLFEKQPPASYISLESPDYKLIERVLMLSSLAGRHFSLLYQASDGNPDKEQCHDGKQWAREVARRLKWKVGHRGELTNGRRHPHWEFYRRNDYGVTAFRLRIGALSVLAAEKPREGDVVLDGQGSYLVKTGALKNTVSKEVFDKASKLLGAYGVAVNGLTSLLQRETILFLPTDSHLICVTEKGLLAIETDGGLRSFQNAESLLRQRHQYEAAVLHSSIRFQWSERIDDERFEELVLDLLNREPGVRWVRRVGTSRASDGERDLIAEWQLRPAPWESATKKQVLVCRRVVVQCKAYTGSINRSKVGDVPGTVDLHNANGYLLVAHPRITPALLDYLTKVPAKRNIWADWWTQPEIEEGLRSNLDIAYRYPDLFRITPSRKE